MASYDEWLKRNLAWSGLKNIAGEAMIKLDPTPGNWIINSALPWYSRNVEQHYASALTRPMREAQTKWGKAGNWDRANILLQSVLQTNPSNLSKPFLESYTDPNEMKAYREWDSPWGVKGVAEVATPTNFLGPAGVGKGASAVLSKGAKLAAKSNAPRLAAGLSKGATGAFRTGEVLEHPLETITKGPKAVYTKAALRGVPQPVVKSTLRETTERSGNLAAARTMSENLQRTEPLRIKTAGTTEMGKIVSPDVKTKGFMEGMQTGTTNITDGATARVTPMSNRVVNWALMKNNKYIMPIRSLGQEVATEMPSDVLSRVAETGKYPKKVIGGIDPRRAATTEAQKISVAARMSQFSGDELADHAVVKLQAQKPEELFGYTQKNMVPKKVAPTTWEGEYTIHEVLANPSKFDLTPAQKSFADDYHAMMAELSSAEDAFGMPAKKKTSDEFYVPKHTSEVMNQRNPLTGQVERLAKGEKPKPGWDVTTEVPYSRMTGKPEIYKTQVAGELRGVKYHDPVESARRRISEFYRGAVSKELTDKAQALARAKGAGVTPLERMPQGLRQLTQGVGRQVSDAKYVTKQLKDAVAQKRLAGSTLKAIERRNPEIAAKLADIMHTPMPNVEKALKGVSKETWEYVENNRKALVKAGTVEVREGGQTIRQVGRVTADDFMAAIKETRARRISDSIGATGRMEATGKGSKTYASLQAQIDQMVKADTGPVRISDVRNAASRLGIGMEAQEKLLAEVYERTGHWRMTQASDISADAISRLKGVQKSKQKAIFAALEDAKKARTQSLKELRAMSEKQLGAAQAELAPLAREFQHEKLKASYAEVGTEIEVRGQIYPAEIGEPIAKFYENNVNDTLKALEKGVEVLRMGQSGYDLGVEFLHLLPTTLYDPQAWAKGTQHMVSGLFDMKDRLKYMEKNWDAISEMKQYGIGTGPAEMVAAAGEGGVLTKIPVVKQVTGAFESSFSSALLVAKTELWKSLRSKMMVNGVLDPERAARYAAFIRNMTGTLETKMLGIGPNQRAFENVALMYASRYTRAGFAIMDDAIRGGVTRKESIRALTSFAVASAAMYYGICKATGQEPQFDPSKPGRFMTLKVGNSRVGIGGFHSALLRFLIGAVANPGDIINPDDWQDSGVVRFIRGRASIPTSIAWDVLSRQTYLGDPIEDMGDFTKEEVARRILPFWVSDWALPQNQRPGAVEPVAQFFGLRAFGMSYAETRDDLRNKYAQQDFGGSWDEVNKLQQKMLLDEHPDLAEVTELAEINYSEHGGPNAKEWRQYKLETQRINDYVDTELTEQDAALSAGKITPKEFRLATDKIYSQGRAMKQMLESDDRFSSVFAFFNDPSKDTSQLDAFDVAYADYCNQLYSDDLEDQYGQYNYAEAERRKQAIRQKYGESAYQYVQERLSYGDDVPGAMARLRKDRETLKPYWQIADQAWAAYPEKVYNVGGEMLSAKEVNDKILILASTDPDAAEKALRRYPRIVALRRKIAQQKKLMLMRHPEMKQALIWYR